MPEKGPFYRESPPPQDKGSLLIHEIRTVQVIDDELRANHMLQRGGWRLLPIKGALAPACNSGPILFGFPRQEYEERRCVVTGGTLTRRRGRKTRGGFWAFYSILGLPPKRNFPLKVVFWPMAQMFS